MARAVPENSVPGQDYKPEATQHDNTLPQTKSVDAAKRQRSTVYVGADDWEEGSNDEEGSSPQGRSRWDREFDLQWTKSRSSSVASSAAHRGDLAHDTLSGSSRALKGGNQDHQRDLDEWTPSGMLRRGKTGSNTTLGRGGNQLIEGYLNFSAR